MNCKLTLQEKLKDLRNQRGLSLVELSEKTGILKSALGSYEYDDAKMRLQLMQLLHQQSSIVCPVTICSVLPKIQNFILSLLTSLVWMMKP